MKKSIVGGCFCGAVRYRLLQKPMFINCCHCTDCQSQTGSAFVINGIIETDQILKMRGKLEVISMPTKSKRPHDIYRCVKCKVAVWSDYGRRKWLRFVRISTLDNRRKFRPDAHIFTRLKLPWVKIPSRQPQFKIYYDMAKQWSQRSLRRREIAAQKQ